MNMNRHKLLYVAGVLGLAVAMMATPRHGAIGQHLYDEPDTLIINDSIVTNTLFGDSLLSEQLMASDTLEVYRPSQIFVLSKVTDEGVILRWAPESYSAFRTLRDSGYVVRRIGGPAMTRLAHDTLAIVRSLTVDEFKKRFEPNDSMAGMAVQLMWGNLTQLDQTEQPPGTFSAYQEVWEQQEDITGTAMMIAELRPDLAEAMGLLYIDRTAKKGADYMYSVLPNLSNDSICDVRGGIIPVKVEKTAGQSMAGIILEDSLTVPMNVAISWPNLTEFSAYNIERREVASEKYGTAGNDWKQLNEQPYVSFKNAFGGDNARDYYHDLEIDHLGVYEYRVSGVNSFGEVSEPTLPHRVEVKDIVPPVAPLVKRFEMHYHTDSTYHVNIVFEKDTLEEDLAGYRAYYQMEKHDSLYWHPLHEELAAPTDTTLYVDVSGLSAGHVAVGAVDQLGNISYSMPMLLNIEDHKPPTPPTELRANVSPDGLVILRWNPSPEPDVHHYEVFRANDMTEIFAHVTGIDQVETVWMDSLELGVNQAYIFYYVTAVDGTGNASKPSDILRVVRPNYIPPSVCRIDSVSMDDHGIYMRWIQSNEDDLKEHRLYRKINKADHFDLISVYRADSVALYGRNIIEVHDTPPYEQKERYVYAMETVNLTGVTSGLSQPQTFLFTGPAILPVDISLSVTFDEKAGETRLAWDTKGIKEEYGTYYYNVYRKGPDDKNFQFILMTPSEQPTFSDKLTRPGEQAEYYVTVRFDDGRKGNPSNTVSVKAPEKH